MKKRLLTALLSTVCALTLLISMGASVLAESGVGFPWTEEDKPFLIEEILERDGLIDGIWYPWFDGGNVGHSLTSNEVMSYYYGSSWTKVAMDSMGADKVYREIYNLKAMGYNLLGYGGSIYDEGVIFNQYGDVIGIKDEFLNNSRRLLDMCRDIGMPVMWTVHFHSSSSPDYHGMDAYNLFSQKYSEPTVREHYMERFVRPLCKMLNEYSDIVALIAIADEPENEINDSERGNHFSGIRAMYGVTTKDKVEFMRQINEVVKEELPHIARTVASNDDDKTIYAGFDLDLMGHNRYNNSGTLPEIENYKTDSPIIMTEYNVGEDLPNGDDIFSERLISYREDMFAKGYKGGVQWCWLSNGLHGNQKEDRSRVGYYLLESRAQSGMPNTNFVSSVTDLRHHIDDYRAEHQGKTVALDKPVMYANEGKGYVEWIPSRQATKMDLLRSVDNGVTWEYVLQDVNQSDYVLTKYKKGRYKDDDIANSMYKVVVRDGKGNEVESDPGNVAHAEEKYKRSNVTSYPRIDESGVFCTGGTYQNVNKAGHVATNTAYTLYSFGEDYNRPDQPEYNLIKNGGFESTYGAQWNKSSFITGDVAVVRDPTAPEGVKSLYFNSSATTKGQWYTFEVAVQPYTKYVFSTWIKGPYLGATNRGFASVGVIDPSSLNESEPRFMWYPNEKRAASWDKQQIFPTAYDNQWHLRSVAFDSRDMTKVTIGIYGDTTQMWLDDMALFENGLGVQYYGSKMLSSFNFSFEDVTKPACTDSNSLLKNPRFEDTTSDFWQTGHGWRNGFLSVEESAYNYGNALKYTATKDAYGLYYIKWIDVEPDTDYVFSFSAKVLKQGEGKLVLMNERLGGPDDEFYFECDADFHGTDWVNYAVQFNTDGFERIGLGVCDLGGSMLIDNLRLFRPSNGNSRKDLFVKQPTDTQRMAATAPKGKTAKVYATATGDGIKYTWYIKNKGASAYSKSSVTTGTYSTTMSTASNGRQLYCVVSDKWGNKRTTPTSTLHMGNPLKITTQPTTGYAKNGATVKTAVKTSGDSVKYTWYVKNSGADGYTKSSITSATYSTKMSSASRNRSVYCVVTDKHGNRLQTKTVVLRMAATITTQPKGVQVKNGAVANITVKAAGDGLKYTWYVKNSGAKKYSKSSITSATYSTKMSSASRNRTIYCVVKDKYGKTVTSNAVVMRMAASITTQPKSVTVKNGTTANVTVKAAGDGLTYTWYVKNPGTTTYIKSSIKKATYSVKMTSAISGRQVYCVVKDKYGKTATTNTVSLKKK